MATRGMRGATTVDANERREIRERTLELLEVLVADNGLQPEDVASAIFTVTDDLDAEFPALAVRSLTGWEEVPLLCAREIPVSGALAGACGSCFSGTPSGPARGAARLPARRAEPAAGLGGAGAGRRGGREPGTRGEWPPSSASVSSAARSRWPQARGYDRGRAPRPPPAASGSTPRTRSEAVEGAESS